MSLGPRQMRLSERHVALLRREIADPGPMPGMVAMDDADYAQAVAHIMAEAPGDGDIWVFAYGSLIWKPACDFVETRVGLVRGWHRAFCLGWNTRFRGSAEAPGLMLALAHGGSCKGALYRLPPDAVAANLKRLLEREVVFKPVTLPPRWVNVDTSLGPLRALTFFCIPRSSPRYVGGLDEPQIADVLAKAIGHRGSMAEYLHQTVHHLEEMGIHDHHLWRLQELVAERIEAAHPGDF